MIGRSDGESFRTRSPEQLHVDERDGDTRKMRLVVFDLDETLLTTETLRTYRHGKKAVDLSSVLSVENVGSYPGIQEALTILAAVVPLGIVSSSPRWYVEQLLLLYFPEVYFSPIVTYDDVDDIKPSPEPIELALRLARVQREDVLFVGDHDDDYRACVAAGVSFLGAQWAENRTYPAGVTREAATPLELPFLCGVPIR